MIGHENPNNTRELTRIIRPVRRAVVDHDDFAIVPGLRRVLEDAHESGPEAFLLVVRGDDDADVQVGRPPAGQCNRNAGFADRAMLGENG